MPEITEEWRPIDGLSGYAVSDLGRIKSVARVVIRKNGVPCSVKEKILSLSINNGYRVVRVSIERCKRIILVHVAVLTAFGGPRPSKLYECAHWDGVRHNNVPSNLRWATRKENKTDSKRHGTWHTLKILCGAEHLQAKLTATDVEKIRLLRKNRTPLKELAKTFGVRDSEISRICTGVRWAHTFTADSAADLPHYFLRGTRLAENLPLQRKESGK